MAQVNRPAPRGSDIGNVLGLGGALAGGILASEGGAGAAIGGAVLGSSAGQIAGGIADPPAPAAQSIGNGSEAAAMARKQQQMGQDNLAVLKQAEAHLPTLPEDLRQQYGPPIIQARMAEQQRRGM